MRENPRAVLIEKPLCPPTLNQAQELWDLSRNCATKIFVGYDHAVGKAAQQAEILITSGAIGEALTLDVEFREHWRGIFQAHPWLNGRSPPDFMNCFLFADEDEIVITSAEEG